MQENYDVIVIGAGLGGLTAAALLAKAGRKVLVVEKEKEIGGYFGPVLHNGYYFNNGPRLLMGCNENGPHGPGLTYRLLETLGVQNLCEFIPLQPFTSVRLAGMHYDLYTGREEFLASLRRVQPHGFERLPELLNLCSNLMDASTLYYTARSPMDFVPHLGKLAETMRYSLATMEDVISHFVPDRQARSILSVLYAYLGLSPNTASFLYWANLMAAYVDEGAYFCRGGLRKLPEAVAYALTRDGGDMICGVEVNQILGHGRKVQGVVLSDGRSFFAPLVIANIDPRLALGTMLTPDQRSPAYLSKLNRLPLSIQGLSLFMKTDLDLPGMNIGYETLLVDDLDPEKAYIWSLTRMNAADAQLVEPGYHLVSLYTGLTQTEPLSSLDVQTATKELIRRCKLAVPGLFEHLDWRESADLPAGFLIKVHDAIYGWPSLPQHSGLFRLSPTTPIRGLTLAGQWTRPGQGTTAVIMSGIQAARRLLGVPLI